MEMHDQWHHYRVGGAKLAGSVLLALSCAGVLGCSKTNNVSSYDGAPAPMLSQDSVSGTTMAADQTPVSSTTSTTTTTIAKHKKKHKQHTSSYSATSQVPVVASEDDSYFYDSGLAEDDPNMIDPSSTVNAVDASHDFDDSVSGTTMAPPVERETGLSPFAQEPDSRLPYQAGSGQITGEDKSTTIFDGPGLFQDQSALGRDLIR